MCVHVCIILGRGKLLFLDSQRCQDPKGVKNHSSQVMETLPGDIHLILLLLDQGQLRVVLLWEEPVLALDKGENIPKIIEYFSFHTGSYFARNGE